jgi:O-antigen/teichoic acid export membrane protein
VCRGCAQCVLLGGRPKSSNNREGKTTAEAAIRTLNQMRSPLPAGTFPVGAGLLVNGFAAYGFLVISARMLGPAAYAPLSVLWTLIFLAGPGFFLPIEQELGRRLAGHPEHEGRGNLIARAGLAGAVLASGLTVATLIGARPILDHLLAGKGLLLVGLIVAMATYCISYVTRGVLSGTGQFNGYGFLVGSEGALRVAACAVIALLGISTAGPYGVVIGLAPLGAVALVAPKRLRRDRRTGVSVAWRELSGALSHLLTSQVLAQLLVNAGPLAVALLATNAQQGQAGRFLACLVLARVPLFLFQAVQAALLPKLAALVHQGREIEFRTALRRLTGGVSALIALVSAGAFLLGPETVRFFFGPQFELGRSDLFYLAAGSGIYMIAIVYAQALIALEAHSRVTVGWLAGLVGFVVATAAGSDLLLRVESGLVAGASVAALVMAGMALERMRARIPLALTAAAAPNVASH